MSHTMSQAEILKLIAGASTVARNTSKIVSHKTAEIIEENIIKGKYVSREEYNLLKNLVVKLQKDLDELKMSKKK